MNKGWLKNKWIIVINIAVILMLALIFFGSRELVQDKTQEESESDSVLDLINETNGTEEEIDEIEEVEEEVNETHLECSKWRCVAVEGSGDDECQVDADCESEIVNRVFVTSKSWKGGKINRTSGADDKCAEAAEDAELEGKWKAWISDDNESARDRFEHSENPYVLLDKSIVAYDWDDLTDGSLEHPINITEKGEFLDGIGSVWTATSEDGLRLGNNCGNWENEDSSGVRGSSRSLESQWTFERIIFCNERYHLYCFERP